MNLWILFPESIMSIKGILYLPYLALVFYVFVLFVFIKFPEFRLKLLLFILITVITNVVIITTLGPSMGTVLIPLLLLVLMFMPLIWLISQCLAKNKKYMYAWSIVTISGWLHSLSWMAWIFALARS